MSTSYTGAQTHRYAHVQAFITQMQKRTLIKKNKNQLRTNKIELSLFFEQYKNNENC